MSRVVVWWVVLGVWVVASVWVHLGYIKRIGRSEEPVLPPVRITDGAAFRVQLPGRLFSRNGGDLSLAENQSVRVRAGLNALAVYLKGHPRRLLTVTGYHAPDESQRTLVTNLGAVRARAVGNYLLNAGVPDDQLALRSRASASLRFIRDSTSALAFAFDSVVIDAHWLARHQRYTDLFHPLQLYFLTGSTAYIPTPDNEQFARDALAYLRQHPRDRLLITGHTDSVGTATGNRRLSQLRAQAVRDGLLRQGATARGIRTIAMGDRSPVASNAQPEGREANRRVTLVIQRR